MDALFLGIDTGTQGVRIGISDAKGNILTTHEKKWETIYPKMGWEIGRASCRERV